MIELKDTKGNTFYRAYADRENGWVYSGWFGVYLSVEQIQEAALAGLELLKEAGMTKLLNDNSQLEGVWDEANEWIANVWMPQAIGAGLHRFAHILSPDLFAQLSAEFMEDNSKVMPEEAFQLRLFNSREEAEAWLQRS